MNEISRASKFDDIHVDQDKILNKLKGSVEEISLLQKEME